MPGLLHPLLLNVESLRLPQLPADQKALALPEPCFEGSGSKKESSEGPALASAEERLAPRALAAILESLLLA